MGVLREIGNGKEYVLDVKQTIGRRANCTILLHDYWTAPMHAELYWDGNAWIIREFAPMNGTYFDRARLRGGPHALRQGSVLGFGRIGPDFELVDDTGPRE